MEKCFIQELQFDSNNHNLPVFKGLEVKANADTLNRDNNWIRASGCTKISTDGNYIIPTWPSGGQPASKVSEVESPSGNVWVNDACYLFIEGSDTIKYIGFGINYEYNIALLPNLPLLETFQVKVGANIFGDICEKLKKSVNLTTINISQVTTITGRLEDLLDALVAGGRNSGTLSVSGATGITYQGSTFGFQKTFTFDSEGWHLNT